MTGDRNSAKKGRLQKDEQKKKSNWQVWKTGLLLTGKIPPAEPGDDLRQAQPRVLGLAATVSTHGATLCLLLWV